ncbi:type VII secretion integral membrane protein EccD [Mycolicibacterium sphagni]|uniref:Type VII secretion integral membrane protein EccD n=1 Tax=Mycolicibacterium sphagni TaxID=1786 RepID=A0ABX2JSM1_9MYCO|nr:type VII secretion integral membrane protein EccD [Mycolicibacterium sphagni]
MTVLTGRRMTDLALPAAAPMETYLDDAVSALADLLEDTPPDVLAGFDFSAQGVWAFARPGAPPLSPDQSLDDAGVVDGSLLTLVPVSRTERYRPLVEDVIDAIAVLDESPQFDRTALTRFVAVTIPVTTTALTVLAALGWWADGRDYVWPLVMGVLGIVLLAGSIAAAKMYKLTGLSESLLIAAYPVIVAAVALAIPPPQAAAALGAPQWAGGAAAVMLLTLVTRGGPSRRIELATFTVVASIALTLAAICFGYDWQHWVPAGAIVFGLFTVTNAAKLTVAVARIALPPIPAPGESVAHDELLDAVAGREEPDGETPTWRAIIASVPDSAVRLTERSHLAKRLLIGFVTAGTLVLALGAISIVVRGHFFIHSLVVVGLVTVACAFRSRLYAERWCAWALLAATVAIPLGVVARLSHWYPHSAWLMLGGFLAAAVVALAVVAAAAGVRRISPVTKRIMELVDGVVIAAILPMLLWITGVYDIVRNIRF